MQLPYKLEIVPSSAEGGYAASYPELPGCITTGDTVTEAFANAQDAKKAWIEAALEEGLVIPEPLGQLTYSGQFKLRIPKSMHMQLSVQAKNEGISMNQYCIYLLAKGMGTLKK